MVSLPDVDASIGLVVVAEMVICSIGFAAAADCVGGFDVVAVLATDVSAFGFEKNDAIEDFPETAAVFEAAVFGDVFFGDSFCGVCGSVFISTGLGFACLPLGDSFVGSAFGTTLLFVPFVATVLVECALSIMEGPLRFVCSMGRLTLSVQEKRETTLYRTGLKHSFNEKLTPPMSSADGCPNDCNSLPATPG